MSTAALVPLEGARCRASGADDLLLVLDMGEIPLGDLLVPPERLDQTDPTFPLEVAFSPTSALVQLGNLKWKRVNPYDADQAAAALARALAMPAGEQARRLRALRAKVATYDSRWWAHELLRDAAVARPHPVSARAAFFGDHHAVGPGWLPYALMPALFVPPSSSLMTTSIVY